MFGNLFRNDYKVPRFLELEEGVEYEDLLEDNHLCAKYLQEFISENEHLFSPFFLLNNPKIEQLFFSILSSDDSYTPENLHKKRCLEKQYEIFEEMKSEVLSFRVDKRVLNRRKNNRLRRRRREWELLRKQEEEENEKRERELSLRKVNFKRRKEGKRENEFVDDESSSDDDDDDDDDKEEEEEYNDEDEDDDEEETDHFNNKKRKRERPKRNENENKKNQTTTTRRRRRRRRAQQRNNKKEIQKQEAIRLSPSTKTKLPQKKNTSFVLPRTDLPPPTLILFNNSNNNNNNNNEQQQLPFVFDPQNIPPPPYVFPLIDLEKKKKKKKKNTQNIPPPLEIVTFHIRQVREGYLFVDEFPPEMSSKPYKYEIRIVTSLSDIRICITNSSIELSSHFVSKVKINEFLYEFRFIIQFTKNIAAYEERSFRIGAVDTQTNKIIGFSPSSCIRSKRLDVERNFWKQVEEREQKRLKRIFNKEDEEGRIGIHSQKRRKKTSSKVFNEDYTYYDDEEDEEEQEEEQKENFLNNNQKDLENNKKRKAEIHDIRKGKSKKRKK